MRLAARIELTEQEHQQLLKLRRSRKTAVRLVERLDIVLLAHEGKTNQVIAEQLGISENKVGRWRNRYLEQGLSGLQDAPRPGRPRRFSPLRTSRCDVHGHP